MPDFEIFTTGGGYYLYDIFNFLAMYTSGSNFEQLIALGSVLGVVMATIMIVFFSFSMKAALSWVMTMMVVSGLTFGPKARVIIIDETKGIPVYGIVDDVPFLIALVGHYTSSFGHTMSQSIEALLSTPTDLSYQRTGMVFGASLLSQSMRWQATTASFNSNLIAFMDQCVVDAANLGYMDLTDLANASDLEEFITANNSAALAYRDEVTGNVVKCSDGWPNIVSAMHEEVDNVITKQAASLYNDPRMTDGSANVGALVGTMSAMQNFIGMSSVSATENIAQTMYIRSLDDAISRQISSSGNTAAMNLYQAARAEIQLKSSYGAAADTALKVIPLLKVAFETMYYASFPLAVFMMMTPMAASIFKGYFSGFVWLASWEPMNVVLHSILLKASSGFYRGAGVQTSGGSINEVVTTFANNYGIMAVEQDIATVGGSLLMSTPILSIVIFLGATRVMGMATSMLNVSQGAAIETGREMATGNFSLGNASMSNFSANKWNTSAVRDSGLASFRLADGSMYNVTSDGGQTIHGAAAVSQTAMGASLETAIRSSVSEQATRARSAVTTTAEDFSQYVSGGVSEFSDMISTAGRMSSTSTGGGSRDSNEYSQSMQRAQTQIEQFAKNHDISQEASAQLALAAQAGIGFRNLVDLSGQLRQDLRGMDSERLSNLLQEAKELRLGESLQEGLNAYRQSGYSAGTSTGENASEGQRYNFEEAENLARKFGKAVTESENYSRAEDFVSSQSGSARQELSSIVFNSLLEEGLTPEKASRYMNPKTLHDLENAQRFVTPIVQDILSSRTTMNISDSTQGFDVSTGQSIVNVVPQTTTALSQAHAENYGYQDRSTTAAFDQNEQDGEIISAPVVGPANSPQNDYSQNGDQGSFSSLADLTFNKSGEVASEFGGGISRLSDKLGFTGFNKAPSEIANPRSGRATLRVHSDTGSFQQSSDLQNAYEKIDPQVQSVISQTADKYGLDRDYMMSMAWIESRGNPSAQAGSSSAGGLYQFIDSTAKDYGLNDKFDAAANADAAARLTIDNFNSLQLALRRAPSAGELYLAHQQGSQGAIDLLTNPSARAVDVVGQEAVLNNGGNMHMNAADFAYKWVGRFS